MHAWDEHTHTLQTTHIFWIQQAMLPKVNTKQGGQLDSNTTRRGREMERKEKKKQEESLFILRWEFVGDCRVSEREVIYLFHAAPWPCGQTEWFRKACGRPAASGRGLGKATMVYRMSRNKRLPGKMKVFDAIMQASYFRTTKRHSRELEEEECQTSGQTLFSFFLILQLFSFPSVRSSTRTTGVPEELFQCVLAFIWHQSAQRHKRRPTIHISPRCSCN